MTDPWVIVFSTVGAIFALAAACGLLFRRTTIFEYERGLRFRRGRFARILEPGQYWFCPLFVRIDRVDTRPRFVSVGGQEVLTSDGVSIKMSLAARFEVVRPDVAFNEVLDYEGTLYLELQLALRRLVSGVTADTLLAEREAFGKQLLEANREKAERLGLELHEVDVKDVMFPGALKQTFAQVVQARKEGEAALERARGESAALRNLANAAKLTATNPSLLQLRLLHSLSAAPGSTLVLGLPPESFPVVTSGHREAERSSAATATTSRTKRTKKTTTKKK